MARAIYKQILSFRDLVEMMAECGLSMAHTTIMRWVHRYVPEFERRWNRFALPVGSSWRVDETYLPVAGFSDPRILVRGA
jgi:transposase-like protein